MDGTPKRKSHKCWGRIRWSDLDGTVSKKTLQTLKLPDFLCIDLYLTMFQNLLRIRSLLGKARAARSSQCVCPESFARSMCPSGPLPSDSAVRSDHDQTKWCLCVCVFHSCTWNILEPLGLS